MNSNNEMKNAINKTGIWRGLTASIVAVMLALGASHAGATLLVYESFDYTASGTVVGGSGGTGFASTGISTWSGDKTVNGSALTNSSTAIAQGSSLAYSGLTTAGGSVALTPGTSSAPIYRSLGSNYSYGTYYMSFLVQKTNSGTGNLVLSLLNGTASTQVLIGQLNQYDAAGINDKWAIRTPSTGIATSSGVSITNAVTLLVLKVDMTAGADTLSLYVNPTSSTEPGSANLTYSTDIGQFNMIGLVSSYTYFAATTVTGSFDEFRLGTTFADVAPIPEPGSVALVSLGLAGLVWFSRRKLAA